MRKCTWTISDIQYYGFFHQFGPNCASDAEGYGVQWLEAIVEDTKGNIKQLSPSDIQFIPNNFINEEYLEHKKLFGF